MEFRVLTVAALVATVFAGCLSDEAPTAFLGLPVAGEYIAHPAYGFLTNADLPVTEDGQTRIETSRGVQWFKPAHPGLPEPLAAIEEVAHVDGVASSGGIAVFGPLAFAGGRSAGPMSVIDISDPMAPVVVSEVPDVPVRDADTIVFPNGRLIVITTAGGADQYATDVTDPAAPFMVSTISTSHRNHNIAVVPGTPIVYNSGSDGVIDIVDYSDPASPVEVGSLTNDHDCHDITFFIDPAADKFRAYCAGYPETQIWDITDPVAPEIIHREPFPGMDKGTPVGDMSPVPDDGEGPTTFPLSFSHLAMVNHDATIMIVGDETGGGLTNLCDANVAGESGPLGNLYFYDITDETAPVLLSHISPSFTDAVEPDNIGAPDVDPSGSPTGIAFTAATTVLGPAGTCTAHFGRLVEDTGFLVMSFYSAGVALIDFRDPAAPVIVDLFDQGGNVWDVWYHQGYLYTGDIERGFDVLKLA